VRIHNAHFLLKTKIMNNQKSKRAQYKELLDQYWNLKDEIMQFTDDYHDAMYYDFEGYHEYYMDGEYDYMDELRNQVEAFTLLLSALTKIKYVFS
jgi:hypothetical protein